MPTSDRACGAPVDNRSPSTTPSRTVNSGDPLGQVVRAEIYSRYDGRPGPEVGSGVEAREPAVVVGRTVSSWTRTCRPSAIWAHETGRLSGRFQYAEGWRRHLHLAIAAQGQSLVEAIRTKVLMPD